MSDPGLPPMDLPADPPPGEAAPEPAPATRPTELFRRLERNIPPWQRRLTTVAASIMLGCLALALLHFLLPNPVTLALLMAVGNVGFGAAACCYGVVVVADLRRRRAL